MSGSLRSRHRPDRAPCRGTPRARHDLPSRAHHLDASGAFCNVDIWTHNISDVRPLLFYVKLADIIFLLVTRCVPTSRPPMLCYHSTHTGCHSRSIHQALHLEIGLTAPSPIRSWSAGALSIKPTSPSSSATTFLSVSVQVEAHLSVSPIT